MMSKFPEYDYNGFVGGPKLPKNGCKTTRVNSNPPPPTKDKPKIPSNPPSLSEPTPKTDPSKISINSVHSHRKDNGTIVVEVWVTNRASFEQPFPTFLVHNDGRMKKFKPSQYMIVPIPGCTARATESFMVIGQPLRVRFEFKCPGEGFIGALVEIDV